MPHDFGAFSPFFSEWLTKYKFGICRGVEQDIPFF